MSGLLLALSFPPFHPLVLPFVGLVPFALWMLGLPDDAEGRRAAGRGGAVLGVVYFGLLLHWIFFALLSLTKWAVIGYAAVVGMGAAMTFAFGWLFHHAVRIVGAPLWIALPVTWTALEWGRAHLPGTLAFPWLGLGTSLTGFPELVGVAELVGARGVTFWIALVNALAVGVVMRWRSPGRPLRALWVVVTVVGLPMAWGVWRSAHLELRPAGRVAAVQLDVPGRPDPVEGRGSEMALAALERLVGRVVPGSVDLVVMPEGILGVFPRAPSSDEPLSRLQRYSREVGAPLIFGALGAADAAFFGATSSGGTRTPYNSAFVMEPQGLTDYQYDKRHLVPIVERAPFLPRGFLDESRLRGMYGVGEGWPLVEAGETRYGVLICYESSYPSAARAFRLAGADVLVNITNDAFFGRTLPGAVIALWQHPAHLVMRAIEHRVGVVRSANGGASFFVDPIGRIHEPTPLFGEGVRIDEVRTADIRTFYTRYGDLLGNASALGALLLLGSAIWANLRRTSLDRPPARV